MESRCACVTRNIITATAAANQSEQQQQDDVNDTRANLNRSSAAECANPRPSQQVYDFPTPTSRMPKDSIKFTKMKNFIRNELFCPDLRRHERKTQYPKNTHTLRGSSSVFFKCFLLLPAVVCCLLCMNLQRHKFYMVIPSCPVTLFVSTFCLGNANCNAVSLHFSHAKAHTVNIGKPAIPFRRFFRFSSPKCIVASA